MSFWHRALTHTRLKALPYSPGISGLSDPHQQCQLTHCVKSPSSGPSGHILTAQHVMSNQNMCRHVLDVNSMQASQPLLCS
jgi:hypothetical protein